MLPKFKGGTEFQLMQTAWAEQLDPLIRRPPNNSSILKNVALVTGANVINHGLGRPLQGWTIIRQRAGATVYDTQDSNTMPALTLQLVASAPVTVDLEVF